MSFRSMHLERKKISWWLNGCVLFKSSLISIFTSGLWMDVEFCWILRIFDSSNSWSRLIYAGAWFISSFIRQTAKCKNINSLIWWAWLLVYTCDALGCILLMDRNCRIIFALSDCKMICSCYTVPYKLFKGFVFRLYCWHNHTMASSSESENTKRTVR